jgi:hypothetical protein
MELFVRVNKYIILFFISTKNNKKESKRVQKGPKGGQEEIISLRLPQHRIFELHFITPHF